MSQQSQLQSSYTKTITAAISINGEDSISQFTVLALTGTVTIKGSRHFHGDEAGDITLPAGIPYTITASPYSFLDGYTITPSGGSTIIDLR